VAGWADDPELVATFRAEVEDRLASLQAGLLQLEAHPAPRQLIAGLFRDAHTVKGSARMLGLDGVLQVAHRSEDLLGALRDGRLPVRRDLVDVLLAGCDAILRSMPGGDAPAPAGQLDAVVTALGSALAGDDPVVVPQAAVPDRGADEEPEPDDVGRRGGDSVRVTASKVYDLLDLVGEAELDVRRVDRSCTTVATSAAEHARWAKALRDAVSALGADASPELSLAAHRLATLTDELPAAGRELRELVDAAHARLAQVRDGAMSLAMVPVRRLVAGFPRVVRDVAAAGGKDVRLVLAGEDVELDKQVLDGVSDALKHLVVNAVDHGCEPPAARLAAGKPGRATVTVTARAAGGTVVLEVADDGAGIDADAVLDQAVQRGLVAPDAVLTATAVLDLLFTPGFSTATEVTETSGRGVGLDVVRMAVEHIGGTVSVRTHPGAGTTFVVTVPVTLGVLRCLIASVGDESYAIPVSGVVESVSLRDVPVHQVAGAHVVVRHGQSIPLLDLGAALGVPGERSPQAAVVVRHADRQLAWAVDRLDRELEVVVKDLGGFLGRLPTVPGATIDGAGRVVCLVDFRELVDRATPYGGPHHPPAHDRTGDGEAGRAPVTRRARVLVVEDSVGVRELERVILEGAGYDVATAVDGLDGAARLRGEPPDLVVSDVEMPGMDGFTLTRTIRRTRGWEQVPVVIMTSRGDETDQRAGLEAGASAYLLKTEFDQHQLIETVRRLVGR
jgi:chemotaxis protein histidine kinase CheA